MTDELDNIEDMEAKETSRKLDQRLVPGKGL
jgi:hypothetical protein